jgi:hypothetical protein
MNPSRLFRPWLAPTLAASCAVAAAQVPSPAARYDSARELYEVGHYREAFAAFAELADQGHCDAARVAQQMARYGQQLYAIEFRVPRERIERWQRLPGCPVALAAR